MPKIPVIQHQKIAPGPPRAMAVETPMIFPVPRVAARVVARVANTERFPVFSWLSGVTDRRIASMRPNCLEGTSGIEIDPMLPVDEKKDYVIRKRRYSGFFGTDLDLVLRENHIENLIIVGTKTNCCIRATVTDAFYLDYNGIVVSDCVATNSETVQQVHLEDIKKYLGQVMDSEELFGKLEAGEL